MGQRILIDGAEVGGIVDTDIVERPAIVDKNGQVQLCTPEMERLPVDQLRLLAKLAGGQLVWRKYEVIYREVKSKASRQHAFCDYKDCYALAVEGSNYCSEKHERLAKS